MMPPPVVFLDKDGSPVGSSPHRSTDVERRARHLGEPGTRMIFQGCTASAGLAQALGFKALLGCAFLLNHVVGLDSGITVIPAGSIA